MFKAFPIPKKHTVALRARTPHSLFRYIYLKYATTGQSRTQLLQGLKASRTERTASPHPAAYRGLYAVQQIQIPSTASASLQTESPAPPVSTPIPHGSSSPPKATATANSATPPPIYRALSPWPPDYRLKVYLTIDHHYVRCAPITQRAFGSQGYVPVCSPTPQGI